ncbi:MAG: ABC transporter ATP-binding protein, partial [Sinobacteraceae bacterium]|nr:ABC transporter ATP-binding protein [Nevskiaceae bacterium]
MRSEFSADDGVLRIEHLQVSYPAAAVRRPSESPASETAATYAVRDVSLTVRRGECLGIVGESGAGKSQIFLAGLGLLPASARTAGQVWFDAQPLLGASSAELDRIRGARIGMVFQDPMTSLTPHLLIGDQIAEPLVRHKRMSWSDARGEALGLLQRVGVNDAPRRMRQYPHELSGGMRQRVVIAIALACEPTLLIADEPTTALDVTTQAQILALLLELKQQRRMSLVLITHDLGVLAGVADRVAVMKDGLIVESGEIRDVLRQPREAYTRMLLAAIPQVADAMTHQPEDHIASYRPVLPASPVLPVSQQPPASGQVAPAALDVQGLSVNYRVKVLPWQKAPSLTALDDASLTLRSGEALGIVGESGSGKSTLARAALRLIPAQAGRVLWLGRPLADMGSRELRTARAGVQLIFQDPLASLDPRMMVREIVAEPLAVHRPDLSRAERKALISSMLERVGLDGALAQRFPHQLSGGQCQRVGIARAMVLQPRVLVCDEPVSALDVTIQGQIIELLRELKAQSGLALLFISHNLAVVRQVCDRVLVLYLGRMMELASSAALFSMPRHPYTRELLLSAPIADPELQPERLRRTVPGEAPSPLQPPSGCVYRTRCVHATPVCSTSRPAWDCGTEATHSIEAGHCVACHHWRELASQFKEGS